MQWQSPAALASFAASDQTTGSPEAQWRLRPGSSGPGRGLAPDPETMYRIYLDVASTHSMMAAFAGDVLRGWRASYTSY